MEGEGGEYKDCNRNGDGGQDERECGQEEREGGEYKDCNRKEGEKGTSQEQEQEDPVSSNEQYRNHDFAWEELAFHIGLFFIQNSSELEKFSSGIYQDWNEFVKRARMFINWFEYRCWVDFGPSVKY